MGRTLDNGEQNMVMRDELLAYLAGLLRVADFSDYGPNGLQVEGGREIRRIVGGVTACQALVDAAVDRAADALLVHHGYFWNGENPCVVGMKQRRLRALLGADINLLAYHLPLDAHPELGNNARLAQRLDFRVTGDFARPGDRGPAIAMHGEPAAPTTPTALAAHIARCLGREPLHIPAASAQIRRVAWCSGAAQGYLEAAAALGADAFISGEISEHTVHAAREVGIHYYAAGHHATERGGVMALGAHLAEHFGLAFEFVDIPNPV